MAMVHCGGIAREILYKRENQRIKNRLNIAYIFIFIA